MNYLTFSSIPLSQNPLSFLLNSIHFHFFSSNLELFLWAPFTYIASMFFYMMETGSPIGLSNVYAAIKKHLWGHSQYTPESPESIVFSALMRNPIRKRPIMILSLQSVLEQWACPQGKEKPSSVFPWHAKCPQADSPVTIWMIWALPTI